jgi:hypothetical protein
MGNQNKTMSYSNATPSEKLHMKASVALTNFYLLLITWLVVIPTLILSILTYLKLNDADKVTLTTVA